MITSKQLRIERIAKKAHDLCVYTGMGAILLFTLLAGSWLIIALGAIIKGN